MKRKNQGDPREELVKYIKRFDWELLSNTQLLRVAQVLAEVEARHAE